jgi:hypothetical protein
MVHFAGLWGLTDETLRTMLAGRCRCAPGDEAAPRRGAHELVRTAAIGVPETEFWPWLCQVFRGGGGYGWPALETPSRCSADYLLGSLPAPRAGDSLGRWLELSGVDRCRLLCWRIKDECSVLGFPESGLTLEYRLSAISAHACRLESRVSTPVRHLTEPVASHLTCAVDFLLPAFQIPRLRGCAETHIQRLAAGDTNRLRVRDHQAAGFAPGVPGIGEAGAAPAAQASATPSRMANRTSSGPL